MTWASEKKKKFPQFSVKDKRYLDAETWHTSDFTIGHALCKFTRLFLFFLRSLSECSLSLYKDCPCGYDFFPVFSVYFFIHPSLAITSCFLLLIDFLWKKTPSPLDHFSASRVSCVNTTRNKNIYTYIKGVLQHISLETSIPSLIRTVELNWTIRFCYSMKHYKRTFGCIDLCRKIHGFSNIGSIINIHKKSHSFGCHFH